MTVRRSDSDAATIDGKIYIFGMFVCVLTLMNLLFTSYTQNWHIDCFTSSGGFDGSVCLRSCEVYDVEQNKWSFIPEMQSARSGLKCVVYKNLIYVIGGYNGQSRLSSCESFNPSANYWLPVHDMNSPRSNFGVEVIDDAICMYCL